MVIKRRAVQQTTWLFILVSGLAHAQGSPAGLAAGLSPIGPITLNSTRTEMHPVVNAYVVAAANTSAIQVIVERINTSKRENVLVRVFDPDEKLVYWRYADPSSAVYPAEDLKVLINTTVTPTRAGIYQVRVSSVMNAQVTLGLPAGTGYGLSYGNGTFSPWPGQPTPLWVHAPVHPTRTMRLSLLKVTKPFDVFDVTEGMSLGSVGIGSRTLSLAPSSTTQSHLWCFDLPTSAWSFSATDMPLILCSSQAAAEAIYASVERIPSGPMSGFLVAHKLGLEIAEILPQLLAGMGDGDALYAMANNYPATQPACLAPKTLNEANRRSILVTTILPGVRWALGRTSGVPNQVVDPASPWAGAFGMPWIQGEACTGAPDCPDSGACTGGVCQSFESEQILLGYAQGMFPMDKRGRIEWHCPEPRCVLPLERLHVPSRIKTYLRKRLFDLHFNRDPQGVLNACGDRKNTWLTPRVQAAYQALFDLGARHTVEAWKGDRLVGGAFGVALGTVFTVESMFSHEDHASKLAFAHLCQHLVERGFTLVDCQYQQDHFERFGAIEMPRDEYRDRIARGMIHPPSFNAAKVRVSSPRGTAEPRVAVPTERVRQGRKPAGESPAV